jgi:hypothetical protein
VWEETWKIFDHLFDEAPGPHHGPGATTRTGGFDYASGLITKLGGL